MAFFPASARCLWRGVVVVCLAWVGLLGIGTGHCAPSAVTVAMVTTPRPHAIRPDLDLARVTFHVRQHGEPLRRCHLQVKVTAPPRSTLLSTDFPVVEGTDLLVLASDVEDSTLTFSYVFPIRGTYTFDLAVTPVPDGPEFAPTNLQHTLQLHENPTEVRNAWLLTVSLLVLGGIAGVVLARSAAAREELLASPMLLLLGLLALAWFPENTVADVPSEHQEARREAEWTLEARPTPASATVGQLVQFTIVLYKDGKVFPQPTRVSFEAHHVEDKRLVFQATTTAPAGQISQHLQFFDGAPHTVLVTARPAAGDANPATPLQAVLEMEVQGVHPPTRVQLRTLALLLSVLLVGMAVGFFLPGRKKR